MSEPKPLTPEEVEILWFAKDAQFLGLGEPERSIFSRLIATVRAAWAERDAERERCAKTAEAYGDELSREHMAPPHDQVADDIASRIREG